MYVISINYKKAPLEIRDRFAFSREEQAAFLKRCQADGRLARSVILSTCNRMELYTQFPDEAQDKATETEDIQRRWEWMEEAVCEAKGISMELYRQYGSCYCDTGALRHLHRVASGMDSMVMGEDEILGQVKHAYYLAMEEGCTDFALNTIFKSAITCAKKIKTDTGLSKSSLSVATLASGRILGFLKEHHRAGARVMIIGITGATGSTVMKNIRGYGGISIIGTSRRHKADGQVIGMEGAHMIPYEERYAWMGSCDVIVSATGSPHYTVTSQEWQQARELARRQGEAPTHTLWLDLSVPADIDKQVGAYGLLYQMDYFRELARSNNEKKQKAKKSAELMIEEQLDSLKKELFFHQMLPKVPLMKQAAQRFTFEQILYRVRDASEYEEMEGFFHALGKALEGES